MSDLKTRFERDGYVVIPGLLSKAEADYYRAEIVKLSGVGDADYGQKVFECPDGVSKNRQFWPLIFNEKLLGTVREVLGPTVRYTQHSDLHCHRTGGWHRDSACRHFGVGADWDEGREPYRVTRVAIYLQTYAESHSSLGVIPGSHRFEKRLTDADWTRWQPRFKRDYRIKKWMSRFGLGPKPTYPDRAWTMWTDPAFDPSTTKPSFPVWMKTEPGDTILFNQKLYHCASSLAGPKYAVFLSYSPENEHSRNHMGFYRHTRTDLGYTEPEPELVAELRAANLYMSVPAPTEVPNGFAIPAAY